MIDDLYGEIKDTWGINSHNIYTKNTASLAAKATMSEQETTPLQTLSSIALALSITSKPPRPWLPVAILSPAFPLSIRIDPSQPYNNNPTSIFIKKFWC